MPAILAALGGMLLQLTGSLVGRVLVALGLSVVSYTGVDALLDFFKTEAVGALQGLDPSIMGMLGLLKVGVCINIVFSAMVARAAIQGIQSGSFKRWVLR